MPKALLKEIVNKINVGTYHVHELVKLSIFPKLTYIFNAMPFPRELFRKW